MSSSFRIAIPSYKRANLLQQLTLRFLFSETIPIDRIDIFVASKEEEELYRAALGPSWRLIVGLPGIHRQREFMESYYPIGSKILFMDDDVKSIKSLYKGVPFDVVVERMFDLTEARGCRLWGVYPTDSGLCLKDRVCKGICYIIGACYGMIVSEFKPSYPTQTTEDFVRSIEYFRQSGVLRFEGLGIQTKYFNPIGGLSEIRTTERQRCEMIALCDTYPDAVRLRERNGRMTDVQFRRSKREYSVNPFGI